ncbi:MAG: ankyrin repeat domain-containing protein [Planctomycetota bacterium]
MGGIIVLLWIAGFIAFLVIVKVLQESSFGFLQKAARNGDLSVVESLIEQGTSVDQYCDFNRWTALHAAAYKGHIEIAEFLLKQGANVNVKDKDGYTPLHNTADSFLKGFPRKRTEANRNRIAALLLKHGADVNATTNHGETPLHSAALTNNVALVHLLLENGADPNIQQSQGMTPLHFALCAGKDRVQVVRLLLRHGADSSIKDEYGYTPTDLAKDYHPKLLELLGE